MLDLDIIKTLLFEKEEETKTPTFENDPMNFILDKYQNLDEIMVYLMGEKYREYLQAVFIVAPKPTTFKIVLHNGQYFFMSYLGEAYQATVSGKTYFLLSTGEKQRAMNAIARLLRYGPSLQTKGEDEAESAGESPESETPPAETSTTGGEEAGGGEGETLEESLKVLKNLIESDLEEKQKLDISILSPEAVDIVDQLVADLGIDKSQIFPASSRNIVIYNDDRKGLIKTMQTPRLAKKYGPPNDPNSGKFKVGKVTIDFKPFLTSGEYYELKPQKLGLTTDKFISINQLKKEMSIGIQAHKKLSIIQKKYILGLINESVNLNQKQKEIIIQDQGFVKELLKNLGEPLGAIIYAKQVQGKQVFFPTLQNYPLVDYMVKTADGSIIDVSAKTAKGKGNIIKMPDIYKKLTDLNVKLDPKIRKIFDTIANSSYKDGPLKLIPQFAPELNGRLQSFLKKHPNFPSGSYDSFERIALEKGLIKALNAKFNFSDFFKKYMKVVYVKYGIDKSSLEPFIKVIKGESFSVYVSTKNSTNHDGEKIGFQLK